MANFETELDKIFEKIKDDLIEKSLKYGDIRDYKTFLSKTGEFIEVSIDDKLSRIARGHEYPGDDTIDDLIGYLVLYKIASRRNNEN